jgi:putative transposase
MASHHDLLIHIVFATKERCRFIDATLGERLFAYMGGTIKRLGAMPLIINGVEDHVHLLVEIPPALSVASLVNKVKSNSSRWVKETFPARPLFAWQDGYAAFSVSRSLVAVVHRYIETQQEHHRKFDFERELNLLLIKHGVRR